MSRQQDVRELELMEWKLDHALQRLEELKRFRPLPAARRAHTDFLARLAGEIEEYEALLRVAREDELR